MVDIMVRAKDAPKVNRIVERYNLTTFDKAYNARDGEGRRKLIWAARYARELGATKEYVLELIQKITSYWVGGFPEHDLEVMLNQISRWSFD